MRNLHGLASSKERIVMRTRTLWGGSPPRQPRFLTIPDTHPPIIVTKGYFDLSKVFPKDTCKHALHVHLYFVKLLGCKLIDEGNVRINIGGFSQALLCGTPHKNVFLTFAPAPAYDDEIMFYTRLRV